MLDVIRVAWMGIPFGRVRAGAVAEFALGSVRSERKALAFPIVLAFLKASVSVGHVGNVSNQSTDMNTEAIH